MEPDKTVYVDKKGTASEYQTMRPGHLDSHARQAEGRQDSRIVARVIITLAAAIAAVVIYRQLG